MEVFSVVAAKYLELAGAAVKERIAFLFECLWLANLFYFKAVGVLILLLRASVLVLQRVVATGLFIAAWFFGELVALGNN